MKEVTFLLPCRIESEDRLKNVITSTTYLLKNFPESKVILKEVDTRSHFKFRALPIIKKHVEMVIMIALIVIGIGLRQLYELQ